MNLWMIKISFVLLAHVLFSHHSTVFGAKIKCEFKSIFFSEAEIVYHCQAQNKEIFDGSRIKIDSIEGTHVSGKTNNDVQGLRLEGISNLNFFPENIQSFFKNLITICIDSSNLQEIHQSDLQPFPMLKYLYFYKTQNIESLEKDLFKFNPKLELIWLNGNQISHIDPNVFDNLTKLNKLYLRQNKCKESFDYAKTRSDVESYISRINKGECSEELKTVQGESNIKNGTMLQENNDNATLKFEAMKKNLTSIINDKEQTISELRAKVFEDQKTIDEINKKNAEKEQTINQLTNANHTLSQKINEMNENHEKLQNKFVAAEKLIDDQGDKMKTLEQSVSDLTKKNQGLLESLNELNIRYVNVLQNKLAQTEKLVDRLLESNSASIIFVN